MQVPKIDPKNLTGLADKVVGLGKEVVGTVVGNDSLSKTGQVQQDKGTEKLKAVKAEAEAETHKAKAKSAEQAQRSAQKTKEAVNN